MRITAQELFLRMARLVSERGTCARRKVGCVLVNGRNHVLATGYNGVPSGMPHCIEVPCSGADCESGTGLELCDAIHAEQNALLQCRDVFEIQAIYCTTAPCKTCVKLLANTSCQTIVFSESYPHAEESRVFWESLGREWIQG